MNDFFLADDLSGALDAGAAFLRAHRRVRIVLHPEGWKRAERDEVVGYTTETRNADPARAAAAVREAVRAGQANGGQLLYKKIDSTLRGPVAAELGALLDVMPDRRVLFAPANPRVGRTVRNGVLLVHGVPVAETEFARDPQYPLARSVIRDLLGPAATSRVSIPDIGAEEDLAAAGRKMDEISGAWIGVGSGALAALAAERAAVAESRPEIEAMLAAPSGVLLVGGSAHPLNRRQAQELAKVCGISVWRFDEVDSERLVAGARGELQQSRAAILCAPVMRTAPTACLRMMVEATVELIRDGKVGRIFVTGGETAFAICERLGVHSVRLLREIEPGMTLAWAETPSRGFLLAVKPGGFGDADTWVRAWQALSN